MLCIDDLFKGRHFDREIIILCVRWYLRFKLSFRDLVEMMAERGVSLALTTITRWIQRYVPEFEKRWNRFACRSGASWRVDEGESLTPLPRTVTVRRTRSTLRQRPFAFFLQAMPLRRADACQELIDTERFRDIIVGAEIERFDLGAFVVTA